MLESWKAFAYYLLGFIDYESGRYEDAIDNLARSIDLEPRLVEAHLALTNVYIRLREWSAALKHLGDYLEGNPDSANKEEIQRIRYRIEEQLEKETQLSPITIDRASKD